MTRGFDDLLEYNNVRYANSAPRGFDGIAHQGVLMLTCMDSRIEPLEMVGLRVGEAKILRTPGGRLTDGALAGCIMGVFLLNVERIMIVPHTKCAAASLDDAGLRQRIIDVAGVDVGEGYVFGADPNQLDRLREDCARIRENELIGGRCEVGGFMYDVETGRLSQVC